MAIGGGDESVDFCDREDRRQRFLFRNFDLLEDLPVAFAGDAKEEFQSAVGDFERSGCELFFVDQVQQIVSDLLFAQLIGWRVEVTREFTNLTQVPIVCSLGTAKQLQVAAHLLAKR